MRVCMIMLVLMIAAAAGGAVAAQADPTLAMTRQGALNGVVEGDLAIFKGIAYAAPPVGPLRWKPPQPPAKHQGVRNAMTFGPPCPAFDGSKMKQGRQLSGAYDIFIGIPDAPGSSEDCLHLNIWAPVRAKRAAVMVWIQPAGPSAYPLFDGGALARHGVVLVTMDYRQLTLGNFAHPALTREAKPDAPLSRFQTMDQMAALRWVKENVAAFGGDPHNVTIFGESAGGASTLQLLTIPDAHGLFDKAIVQSGAGWWAPFSLQQMEALGSWAARQAGLPGKDATTDQLRALGPGALPGLGIYSVDARLQRENATTAIANGRMADVPLLIGWTNDDGSSLRRADPATFASQASDKLKAAYAQDGKAGSDLGYQMYTDQHVGAPARWIADRAASGAPSYLYLFSYVRAARRGQVRGAAHGDELPFVFGSWDKVFPQLKLTEEDRAMTSMMQSCWVSFAKTGKPQCEGAPDWPRYGRASDRLMDLDVKPRVRTGFRKAQLDAQEAAMQDVIGDERRSVEDLVGQATSGQLDPHN